ncbi:MAG: hypothetical protein P8Q97_04380 [Myxococcota bacterium]|nr:hypothetical protein [Myxococcota bacterium]
MEEATEGLSVARACGECSLCCRVLRVDELDKLGGVPCVHQDVDAPGCSVHAQRPNICRSYRCLWLSGGLEEGDRPDRLGAVVDVVADGSLVRLEIRSLLPGAFDASPRLAAIAEEYRSSMPVRITDVEDVLNPDHAYRVLLPAGEEHRVQGDRTEIQRPGQPVEYRRLSLFERAFRGVLLGLRRLRIRRSRSGPRRVEVPPGR